MGKLRVVGSEWLPQGHSASQGQSRKSQADSLIQIPHSLRHHALTKVIRKPGEGWRERKGGEGRERRWGRRGGRKVYLWLRKKLSESEKQASKIDEQLFWPGPCYQRWFKLLPPSSLTNITVPGSSATPALHPWKQNTRWRWLKNQNSNLEWLWC